MQGALAEARELYEFAAATPLESNTSWIEARSAVDRAGLLMTPETSQQTRDDLQAIASAIDAAESERGLVRSIQAARDRVFTVVEHEISPAEFARENLSASFRSHRIHPESGNPGVAISQLGTLSPAALSVVIGALDNWLLLATSEERKWLIPVLTQLDDDPWRLDWRQAYLDGDTDALKAMLQAPEIGSRPARDALNLLDSLAGRIDERKRVEHLQQLQPLHPSDFVPCRSSWF